MSCSVPALTLRSPCGVDVLTSSAALVALLLGLAPNPSSVSRSLHVYRSCGCGARSPKQHTWQCGCDTVTTECEVAYVARIAGMEGGFFDCSPLRTGLRAAGGQMKSCGPRRMASVPASFTEQLRHIENLSPLGNYAQLLMKLVHESHETALIVFYGCLIRKVRSRPSVRSRSRPRGCDSSSCRSAKGSYHQTYPTLGKSHYEFGPTG